MSITTGLTNSIKQVAADAMCPADSTLNIALIRVGAVSTYDSAYGSPYVLGLAGDECPTGHGYEEGGQPLGARSAGPSGGNGWVDYADAVWTAVGKLAAIGAVIYDRTNANRVVGFIDFGGTRTASNAPFTVQIPGDGGNGLARIA